MFPILAASFLVQGTEPEVAPGETRTVNIELCGM